MQLSMLCPRGGGPRDEVGTLNVIAHPTWGILANFEHKCWPRDREVWTMKAKRVLIAGRLDTNVPPSWKYPEFPEVQTFHYSFVFLWHLVNQVQQLI